MNDDFWPFLTHTQTSPSWLLLAWIACQAFQVETAKTYRGAVKTTTGPPGLRIIELQDTLSVTIGG